MKKILIIFGIILFSLNCSFAAEPILLAASNHNPIKDYYQFDGDKFNFNPPAKEVYKLYSKEQRKFYKKNIFKNQKLLIKAEKSESYKNKIYYYTKILSKNEFYAPASFGLLNIYLKTKNYDKAITIIQKLSKYDCGINKIYLKEILADVTYLKGDYINALPILLEMYSIDNKFNFNYHQYKIAVSYYNIGNEDNAIKYFKLVNKDNEDYTNAQNYLFKIYFNDKDYKEALLYAKELSKLYPNDARQYFRIGMCSFDNETRLANFYTARQLYISNKDIKNLIIIDKLIAESEQIKINNAVKNLKSFVEKPDWTKILDDSLYSEPYYWSNRQYNFFHETNNCISKYKGNELCKCFEAVNQEQNRLALQRQKDLELKQQREIAKLQAMQQEWALEEQENFHEQQIKLQKMQYIQNQQMINAANRPRTYYINPTGNGGYSVNGY